jgi:hypothetical protein
MTIYDKGKNRGFLSIFALVSFAVLALPCLVSGAGRGSGSSGGFRAARGFHTNAQGFRASSGRFLVSPPVGQQTNFRVSRPGQRTQLHGFHRRGFFDGDGFFNGDGGVITVEQPQPTVIMQAQQPVHKGRYVQPRWVDGGYGVQVLQPGYWTDN